MARWTTFGVAALCAGLGGCHILFGHGPGAGSSRGDGPPPWYDGASAERRAGDLLPADGPLPPDWIRAGEAALALDGSVPSKDTGGCNAASTWCAQASAIGEKLRDVWAADDGSLAYAVGDGVARYRATALGGTWQSVSPLPSTSWRGVHMVGLNAWIVGNAIGDNKAIAYQLLYNTSLPPKSAVLDASSVSAHALSAIWMKDATTGFVAAALGTGGALDPVNNTVLSSGQSTGNPVSDVSGNSLYGWAVTRVKSSIDILYQEPMSAGAWKNHAMLNGIPSDTDFTGVAAFGANAQASMCACGNSLTTGGVVACCTINGPCLVVNNVPANLHGIAAVASPSEARFWVVGDLGGGTGGVLSGTVDVQAGKIITPAVETKVTPVLNAIWVSTTTGPRRLWTVGMDGTILYHEE